MNLINGALMRINPAVGFLMLYRTLMLMPCKVILSFFAVVTTTTFCSALFKDSKYFPTRNAPPPMATNVSTFIDFDFWWWFISQVHPAFFCRVPVCVVLGDRPA